MEYLELATASELGRRLGVHRKKIPAEKWLYIPVKIKTIKTKTNPDGYWFRYIALKDIKNYLRTKCNRKPKEKHLDNSYKRQRKATK